MKRSEMREHIFKIIFSLEFDIEDDQNDFEERALQYLAQYEEDMGKTISDEHKAYMVKKSDKIRLLVSELDEVINKHSDKWGTDRLAKVEKSILRVAVYEILHDDDIPNPVAINEAVELTKRYGADQSYMYVNGLLAKLVK